jgi:hypothetical protein
MFKRVFLAAAMSSALVAPQAHADTWGCEVLLCLSNPAGPMAVSACVPPITRLYRAIFKWRPDPFPTCLLSSGMDSSSGGNYAYVGPASYYDACPTGTTAAPAGSYVAAGRPSTTASLFAPRATLTSSVFMGIGDGSGYSPDPEGGAMPPKVCVGNRVASTVHTTGTFWDDMSSFPLGVYDRIVVLSPAGDTFNINVMINGGLFTSVRPFSRPTSYTFTN